MRRPGRNRTRPTVVDLFAGAGLFSYAFEREGFDVERAVEIDRHAAATYAANFGDRIDHGDVCHCRPLGRCDVLIAGPPCQGFSTLGKRDTNDPRNRLSFEIIRWAQALRPQVVVIENVAAFIDSPVWRTLARRLKGLGYHVTFDICDAVEFGVPQRRVRSATFASRRGPITLPLRRDKVPVTISDAWDGLPRRPSGEGLDVYLKTTPLALARMRVIPPGGGKRDILERAPHLAPPSWLRRRRTEITDVWGRMQWDRPANTLRTEFVNPSKGRYIHPEQHRVISLREAARLQSIPDSFRFVGTVPYVIARQIGNGVPPLLGRAIARQVMHSLR
jgi:DNA (cytosine-5)-methyltransferase 1